MKPHLTLRLDPAATLPVAPSWLDALSDKAGVGQRLHPRIDELLRRHGIGVWVTSEYPRRQWQWTPDEVAAGLNSIYRLVLRDQQRVPESLLRDLQLLPVVRLARLGRIGQSELPSIQFGSEGRRLSRREAPASLLGLEEAHAYTRGNPDITVAVIDTGVETGHPELRGRLREGFDFVEILHGQSDFIGDSIEADPDPDDEVGHGTHVAGIVVGRGQRMPEGVAPGCRVLPVRALAALRRGDQRVGAGLIDNINVAIKWAVDQGADVINMSLGVRHEEGGLPHAEVVEYARRAGVTLVAASGNDGTRQLYFPGALPHVIAVGAAGADGQVAAFSTFGDHVSFIAPGEDIYSSYLDGRYAFASGTSQAAPFAAGAVALLKSFARSNGRRLTDRQVKHVLKSTADRVGTRFKDPKAGFGSVNIADALRWLDDHFQTATEERLAA